MNPSQDKTKVTSVAMMIIIIAMLTTAQPALLRGVTVIIEPFVRYAQASSNSTDGYTLGDTPSEVAKENDDADDDNTPIVVGKENENDILQGTEAGY